MKKFCLYSILPALLALALTSCSFWGGHMHSLDATQKEEAANRTFEKIVDAIKTENKNALKKLFSENAYSQIDDFETMATDFFNFIQGEIISYTDAEEKGVMSSEKSRSGKKTIEIRPIFILETDKETYHILIREYIRNDQNKNNIGIHSVYIINAENWNQDYSFAASWRPGINIVRS